MALALRTAARGAVLYAALTVLMTWPLALHPATELPAGGDNLYVAWSLAWIAHALAHAPSHLLDGNIFFPVPRSLVFSDPNLSSGLLLAPLHYAGANPAVLVNVLLLASFVLSALATGFLVGCFGGDARAALAAGVFFAFSPLRFSHLDHVQLYPSWWIALALATFDRHLRTGRRADAWLTAAAIALQAYTSVYLAVFQVAALGVLFVVELAAGRVRRPWRAVIVGLIAPSVATALVCAPLGAAYLLASRTWALSRSLAENVYYSASPAAWLSAAPTSALWGRLLDAFMDRDAPWEKFLFPGLVPIALAAFAVLGRDKTFAVRFGIILFLLGALLSLGPFVTLWGHRVPLPYGIAYVCFPPLRALRVPARWALVASLGLSLAAGAGASRLPRRVFWLVVFLAVAEAWPMPMPTALLPNGGEPPAVYRFLARSGEGPLVELPLAATSTDRYRLEAPRVYWSALHWRPIANGYSGYTPPPYRELISLFDSESPSAALRFLTGWNIRTVVVHVDELSEPSRAAWNRVLPSEDVQEVFRDDRTRVLQLFAAAEPFVRPAMTLPERLSLEPRKRQSIDVTFPGGALVQPVPPAAIGWWSGRARWTAPDGTSWERWARYFCPPAIPSRLGTKPLFVEPPPAPERYRFELAGRCFTLGGELTITADSGRR
jgi:hypothetical protein